MITSSKDMIRSLYKNQFSGVVAWAGASVLDGSPIALILNRITTPSANPKTGIMVQSFIIRTDIDPLTATKTGQDYAICGDCKHKKTEKNTCYVSVWQAPQTVYKALKNQRYAVPYVDFDPAILPDLVKNKLLRGGSYGDPAAVPFKIWSKLTIKANATNAYTHQWKNPVFKDFQSFCMASVDSEDEYQHAKSLGWRTFRVKTSNSPKLKTESHCNASKEQGQKTSCDLCRACGGHSSKARVDIVINAHGPTRNNF